jgi:TetR/AcrR family transcriptional regulator
VTYLAERREEEKERRRLEIIEAAERIYAEKGWDLLTMDQVARVARLSRTLVYVYFKDKDDLMLAIAGRSLEKLAARFREASATAKRGLDKLEAIGRAYIAFGIEFPHYFDSQTRFNAGHKLGEDRPCEGDCVEAIDKVHTVIVEALRLGISDGSVRPEVGEVEVVSAMLWAFTHGLVQIVTAKAEDLAARGISAELLTENSIRMIQYMLATPPKG